MSNSLDLLRLLEPAVRPAPPASSGGARQIPAALFESQPFDRLLAAAMNGKIHSDRPVEMACDVQPPLSPAQLERLALAADRAEAGGAQQALMMIDGRGLVVDITGRMITAELKPDAAGMMLPIDMAMIVPVDALGSSGNLPSRIATILPTNQDVAKLVQTIGTGRAQPTQK